MSRSLRAGVCLLIAGAIALAGILARAQSRPAASSITALPEHAGWLQWTATGDAGGRLVIRYNFHGFYLWSAPVLSAMGGRLPGASTLADTYTLLPMRTDVTVEGAFSQSTSFERPGSRTDCWTSAHTVNSRWSTTAPSQLELEAVLVQHAPPPAGFVLPQGFMISDRRSAGGSIGLSRFQFTAPPVDPAIPLRATFTDYDAPGDVETTASGVGSLSYLVHLNDQPALAPKAEIGYTGNGMPHANFWFEPGGPVPLGADFDPLSARLVGRVTTTTDGGNPKCSYLDTDESFTFEVTWDVGVQQRVDATIEPVRPDENEWMPEYNQMRDYRITLTDPGPDAIDGIRVSLVGTSTHPGIATNAGHHSQQAPSCAYCTRGVARQVHAVSHDFHGLPVTRRYNGLNECPIDHLPDLFFVEIDNPAFRLVDPVTEGLSQPISQVIELEDATEDSYVVTVMVKDSAASASLIAEVQIGGQWYPVRAIGPTADPLGTELQLPLDADDDGIADVWERRHAAYDAAGDADNMPGGVHLGDGLTAFEEYRGIYALGQFRRTDPEQKTIFVHDYTGRRLPEVFQVRDFYAPKGLEVFAVDGTEFHEDVINYQATDGRRGEQYITVLIENPARPADVGWRSFANDWLTFAGIASHIGPPQQGLNAMALQYRIETRASSPWVVIGHELGHLMAVAHHGDTDGTIVLDEPTASGIPAGRQAVAIKGGQHSGDFNCIMKYEAARLFCKTPVLLPYNSLSYDDYPLRTRTVTALCTSPAGTGTNAGGAWAGDATVGNCTAQVRVRSY